jgi:predicted MFS family arabinose efflux permease
MLFKPSKKNGVDPSERALWSSLLSFGLVFPIAIVLGYFIGRWIGGLVGHRETGAMVGLVWGILAGFWELYKLTKRLEKYDGTVNSGNQGSHKSQGELGQGLSEKNEEGADWKDRKDNDVG